jgi:hypothetical protein
MSSDSGRIKCPAPNSTGCGKRTIAPANVDERKYVGRMLSYHINSVGLSETLCFKNLEMKLTTVFGNGPKSFCNGPESFC